jgi:hypothetical protein
MSFNVGGIYVDGAIPAARVATAIAKYWTKKGATVENGDPRKLDSLSVEKTKKLGYAIIGAGAQVAIADSERYTADHSLARFLAKELKTSVFWYALYGATDGGVAKWFGAKKKAPIGYGDVEEYVASHFAPPFVHLQELGKATKSDAYLTFSKVKGYDEGPEPDEEDEEDEGDEAPAGGGCWVLDPKKKAPFKPLRAGATKNAARDNLTIAFHVAKANRGALAKVFEAFQRVIPRNVLRWACVGVSSTDVRLMKPGALFRAAAQFEKKNGFFFVLSDDDPRKPEEDEPAIPAYAFVFSASDTKGVNRVELRFPSELVWQVGADEVVRFAEEQAAAFGDALYSGSCSIALTSFPLISSLRDPYSVHAIAAQHIGLDVLSHNTRALKTHVRAGARWVDFLGPTLAKHAKGLPGVTAIGKSVAIRTSKEPAIDPTGATLKALRQVAKKLHPIALYNDLLVDFDVDEDEDRMKWERRFL